MVGKQIAFKTTHVQLRELAKIPGDRDIGQARAIDAKPIGTSVFLAGYSQAGVDRFWGVPR
jgi:hypothetical protein